MSHRMPFLVASFAAAIVGFPALGDGADRGKHPEYYLGYSGTHWPQDYAIMSGHCDREAIATFADPHAGVLSSRSPRDNRAAATLIGASVEDLIGSDLGREIDDADRACLGHVLEIGRSGRRVVWDNAATGVHFEMVPDDGHSQIAGVCRDFKLAARSSSGKSKRHATACQHGPGLWQLSQL
jgi:surface antigen